MTKYFKKLNTYLYIYIFVFTIVLGGLLHSFGPSIIIGELDDYTLPAFSFLNDHNFTVSADDYEYAKASCPTWAEYYTDSQNNQGLLWTQESFDHDKVDVKTDDGEQLTWYFPIYSAYIVPFIACAKLFNLQCEMAPRFANLLAFVALLIVAVRTKSLKPVTKIIVILALTVNPIVFITCWASAETFMYALLGISVLLWLDDRHKLAAIVCTVAGMVNTTILAWGLVMIADYMIRLYISGRPQKNPIKIYLAKWKEIAIYALCYVPALIPMAYFYYYMGSITPQTGSVFVRGTVGDYWSRFAAYLFDFNLGFLPYFPVFLLLLFGLVIYSVIKHKDYKSICLFATFFILLLAYSIHYHINCGMAGIARYNNWNAIFLCISVPYCIQNINFSRKPAIVMNAILCAGVLVTGCTMVANMVLMDSLFDYMSYSPLATYVLDNHPALYNPPHSLFYCRTLHTDTDLDPVPYFCPVVYSDSHGEVRKILVDEESVPQLYMCITGDENDIEWFHSKLDSVDSEMYINVPVGRKLTYNPSLVK